MFGEIRGVLVLGVIDELRLATGADFSIEVVEFKTRNNHTPPKASQKKAHEVQVSARSYFSEYIIYNKLMLTCGRIHRI